MHKKNFISRTLALSLVLALGACHNNAQRPDTLAVQARESVEKAQSAGANEKAPLALRDANQYLTEAEEAMKDERYQDAQYLLEKSMVNSELAIARSNATGAKKAAEEIEKNLDTLEQEVTPNKQTTTTDF